MPSSYRGGGTRVAGIVGGVVFFVSFMLTTLATDFSLIGSDLELMLQIRRIAFWIGAPVAFSIAAMWLVLLIRDSLRRGAK